MKKEDFPGVSRGQVYLVLLDPTVGREINTKDRPCIVVSNDTFNRSRAELVVVVPLTGTDFNNPLHVQIKPPQGGLSKTSYVLCDQIRTVSKIRLGKLLGAVTPGILNQLVATVMLLLEAPMELTTSLPHRPFLP